MLIDNNRTDVDLKNLLQVAAVYGKKSLIRMEDDLIVTEKG